MITFTLRGLDNLQNVEAQVPAKNVIKKFHKGKLHSGSKDGPVVKDPKQAKAILLSELRDEGRIPERGKKARNKRMEKAKL